MTDLTTAMEAELSADVYLPFGAIEIALPGGAFLRLLDGPGHLFFDGVGWVGEDTTYGSLLSFEPISDGDQDEVPAVTVSIAVPSAEAAATLGAATMQGAAVRVLLGAFQAATNTVVPDPLLLFLGEVDVPKLTSGPEGLTVELEIVSYSERLFMTEEGERLSDAFHRSIFPGEKGLEFVTGVERTVYWGAQPPKGSVTNGQQQPAGGGGGSIGSGGATV